MLIEYILGH